LEWLKTTRWDGVLPLVTGGGGQGVTPFIEIPTGGSELEGETQTSAGGGNTNTSSSPILPPSVLNRLNPAIPQPQ
jgi:prohibitin 2